MTPRDLLLLPYHAAFRVCIAILKAGRWLYRRGWWEESKRRTCEHCQHFIGHCDPEDEDPMGYCGHPFHRTPDSAHYEYGGYWTTAGSTCHMFEAGPSLWIERKMGGTDGPDTA